jgi:transcriptional regulator with PAS, ATPase and Fis domain
MFYYYQWGRGGRGVGLTTVSYNAKACRDVYLQLSAIIADKVKIRSVDYSDLTPDEKVADDLVLITTPVIKHLVVPFIQDGCKYVIAKRTINPQRMRALFDIPAGADVLVVNVLYESAVDVVQELSTIGITHANFHPYDPQRPLTGRYAIAVTPGEPHLVPEGIEQVIDIGDRLISIATISQVLYHLTGEWADDDLINSRYIQNYVKLSMSLAEQSRYNEMLHRQMEMVITNFEDGVLLTDKNNVITYHNLKASELLGKDKLFGKPLEQVIAFDGEDGNEDNAFVSVDSRSLHVTRKSVDLPTDKKTVMLIIKDLTNIRDIDEQFRKQKKYSGYTARYTFADIMHGSGGVVQALIKRAKALAETDSTVLMVGESGTGKELFAQSIHNASARKGRPFVALNCAALSETLLESELFGYEEGAFTGARKGGKRGLLEMAHTGTVFLDEVGDAPLSIQKKLLRVLQEKEIMRVAGDKVIPIDVRVIAATNRNLAELVAARQFREDLFYRLNVFPLPIPSLRERKEDIGALLDFFLHKYAKLHRRGVPRLDAPIKELLDNYGWPGNVRQLENIAEYIVTVSPLSSDLFTDILQLLSLGAPREKGAPPPEEQTPERRAQIRAILEVLAAKRSDERLGRAAIRRRLMERGVGLTEQQVKTRLAALKEQQLVESVTGKGTTIAAAGRRYLELCGARPE